MKPFLGCGGFLLFLLVVILVAIPLACIATVAVPLIDRNNLQEIACPPGTTLITSWEETTYTRPGERVLNAYCEDAQGNDFQANDLGYGALKFFPKYFLYSLGASFILTLMVAVPLVLIFRFIKNKYFTKHPTSVIGGM